MKKLIVLLLAVGYIASSCERLPSPNNEQAESYLLHLNLQLLPEVIPFPESKSMPELFPPNPVVDESNPVPVEEFSFEYIEYFVFNNSTEAIVREDRIEKDSNDFGSYLYITLPVGTYQITIITHSSTEATRIGTLFYMNDLQDTFLGTENFEINPGTDNKVVVNLTRRVSRVEFIPTDELPEEVKQFRIVIPERYTTLNLKTGDAGNQKESHTYMHTFTNDKRTEEKHKGHAFYTLVPLEINTLQHATLQVMDRDDIILLQKEVKDIPVFRNRITRYKGFLYHTDNEEGTFELDFQDGGKWEDTDEYPLQ